MNIYINKLTFAAGQSSKSHSLELPCRTVTIFVGPNNSGKSQALRDIEALCMDKGNHKTLVVKKVGISGYPINSTETKLLLKPFVHKQPDGTYVIFQEQYADRTEVKSYKADFIEEIHTNEGLIKKHIVSHYLIRLNSYTRFRLIDPENASQKPFLASHLRHLRGEKLDRLNNITKYIFDKIIIPQYLKYSKEKKELVTLEVCNTIPPAELVKDLNTNEKILTEQLASENCELLTEQGDGIQAFVGIMAAVLVRPQTIILIDEPEAFLAPSIVKRLGAELTKIAKERGASLIVATHSSDFIMGCIEETSQNVNLIRLTYDGHGTARKIETEGLGSFVTNPCLRNSAAIRGLFHKAVIVTEAHRDRVFYDEANRRLTEYDKFRGMADALFIDSGGGLSLLFKTVSPLRKMGISAVAVVDVDFIWDMTGVQENLMNACCIPLKKQQEIVPCQMYSFFFLFYKALFKLINSAMSIVKGKFAK